MSSRPSRRLRAFVAVYLLPLRHPVLVDRQLSSVAERYPGRLTFGVGVGGEDPHEFEICGVESAHPRPTHGRRVDPVAGPTRRRTGDAPRRVHRRGQRLVPPGAAARHPPSSSEDDPTPALRRAGRLGDGWIGIWNSARRFEKRSPSSTTRHTPPAARTSTGQHAMQVWCCIGSDPADGRAAGRSGDGGHVRHPVRTFRALQPVRYTRDHHRVHAPYVEADAAPSTSSHRSAVGHRSRRRGGDPTPSPRQRVSAATPFGSEPAYGGPLRPPSGGCRARGRRGAATRSGHPARIHVGAGRTDRRRNRIDPAARARALRARRPPDACRTVIELDGEDAATLASILGAPQVAASTAAMQRIEGLALDWSPSPNDRLRPARRSATVGIERPPAPRSWRSSATGTPIRRRGRSSFWPRATSPLPSAHRKASPNCERCSPRRCFSRRRRETHQSPSSSSARSPLGWRCSPASPAGSVSLRSPL